MIGSNPRRPLLPPPPPQPLVLEAPTPIIDPRLRAGDVAAAPRVKMGFFDRLDQAIKAPGMSGALLRSAGATLNGGLGDGIAAGARYMDERAAAAEGARRYEAGQEMDERRLGLSEDLGYGNLAATVARLEEDARQADQSANVTLNGQGVQMRGQDIGVQESAADRAQRERNADREYTLRKYGIDIDIQDKREGRAESRRQFDNPRPASVGPGYEETISETPAVEAKSGWWGREGTPATPKSITRTRRPLIGSPPRGTAPQPLPANATAETLRVGAVYDTPAGVGRWNGSTFDRVQ